MPLTKLQFRPGINQEITSYANENGWRDCDKIRFRMGYPEKIGGWEKFSANTYQGTARRLHNWVALDGSDFLGVGTHVKYYIEEGTNFFDVTPERKTTTNTARFSATNGSSTVTVTDAGHGAVANDFVTFSSAATLGGLVTATILNAEHQIVSVIDGNTYTITVSVTANSSDTGNGGTATDSVYQINSGLDSGVGGTGWGAGNWGGFTGTALQTTINEGGEYSNSDTTLTVASGTGIANTDTLLIEEEILTVTNVSTNDLTVTRAQSGTEASAHADGTIVYLATGNATSAQDFTGWGDAAAGGLTVAGAQIRLWSHDNFGEDLIINPRDGGLFIWDKTNGTQTRAVEVSGTSGDSRSVPTIAKQVLVSNKDRSVIAFGCDAVNSSSSATQGNGTQDPLLIRFSDQESAIVWFPTTTNTAGSLRLGSGSTFVQALETKREILVFTDTSLSSMTFIGPPVTFGLTQLSTNITIASPASAIATEDLVYWMGIDNFYVYDGQTKQLPCTVKEKVFLDFNTEQSQKVISGVNSEYSEVVWYYPSASSTENDKYVIYNYLENVWYFGSLSRTAWIDRGVRKLPIAASGSHLFNHETGYDDDGSAMTSFIESAVMDMEDGDKMTFLRRVIPDLTFVGSTSLASPQATFTIKARNFPGVDFGSTDSGTATRTSASPVEVFTDQLHVRARGRAFVLRIDSSAIGTKWKLGNPRVDIRQDGRR